MSGAGFCVLDIETAPRPDAVTSDRSIKALADTATNHQITCASALIVANDGRDPAGIELKSFEAGGDEAALIECVESVLPDPARGGTLITFNGVGHDLIVLRSRALATWTFGTPRLRAWCAGEGHHRDLMLVLSADGRARWPSLVAACGALGVPAKVLPYRSRSSKSAVLLSNQCDVLATYILHLHLLAFEAGEGAILAQRWLALAEALGGERAPEHLLPYTNAPRLIAARALITPSSRRS